MNKLRLLSIITVLICGFIAANLIYSASTYPALFPHPVYFQNIIAFLSLSVFLFLLSFFLRKDHDKGANALLLVSVYLLFLVFSDAYILLFRYDTLGPGSGLSITHRNWLEKYVTNNEEGFWERSLSPYYSDTSQKRLIIAGLGDSFTWGQGLPGKELRFTEQLQGKLRVHCENNNIDVLNFGRGGASTPGETITIVNHISHVRPKIVLIFYLSNDIDDGEQSKFSSFLAFSNLSRVILTSSPTYNFLYFKLIAPFKYKDAGQIFFNDLRAAYMDGERLEKHLQDIEVMIETVNEIGAEPIFIILPFPHMWAGVNKNWRDLTYNTIAHRVRETGTPVIELQSIEKVLSPVEFQVNSLDAHPNKRAHTLIAYHVFQWLTQSNISILDEYCSKFTK